ncbi:copper resistance protein B [Sphingomonas sp. 1185]|uniref:copper resistance protein B n=1 Tax=Sphingomonas sp. 1185 TaxID=3156411 RepID=UPI0033987188
MILLSLLLADPMMQHQGMAMPGMTMPMAASKPAALRKPGKARPRKKATRAPHAALGQAGMAHHAMEHKAAASACPPEHAAMGHCQATPALEAGAADPAALPGMAMGAVACPPEHAAMGHCKPAPAAETRAADPVAMPGMAMGTEACPPEHAAMGHCKPTPAAETRAADSAAMPGIAMGAVACPPEHAAMGYCKPAPAAETRAADSAAMPGMAMGTEACSPEHAAMGHCQPAAAPAALVGHAPPPPAPTMRAADRFYDPAVMAAADRRMRAEHGGMAFHQILFNLAEIQVRDGRDGYRWDGEGWFGGDIHRLVVKSEGEGDFGDRVGAAEVQALYARAIDPYWNLQAGVRQDVGSGVRRTYAVVGVEGLAPYWFDVEGALFLSDRGDVLARAEAWVDQRITQRAILQPRIEVNLAAQDVPDQRIAAGVSDIELGLRLRYEIAREFAPYVGVNWERRYGPARGSGAALALGIRGWF